LLTRTTKVVVLLKYKEELSKLKEFITKLQIYISHNNDSFETESGKVLFTISYLEDKVFKFIKTYLDNYNLYITNPKEMRKDIVEMFSNINKFIRLIKKVYKEPYEEEKVV